MHNRTGALNTTVSILARAEARALLCINSNLFDLYLVSILARAEARALPNSGMMAELIHLSVSILARAEARALLCYWLITERF